MGYKQNNPLPMMKSAMKMMKAEKKSGMHRDSAMYMNSPMYSGHSPMERESVKQEKENLLGDMPIIDRAGSPAMAAKPDYIDIDKDGNKEESMKEAAKDKKGSPAMKKQGYNDRLDESLAKDGDEDTKKQSMKDRRDESKGMEKAEGKGAYSSDPGMSRKSSPANFGHDKDEKRGRDLSERAAKRKERKGKGEIRYRTGGGFQGVGKPRLPGYAPGEEHNPGEYVSNKGKKHNVKIK
tara:strand:+ start:677 stop:1387 length:711 start_codon:yes stop_codon:yes gene_type:complete